MKKPKTGHATKIPKPSYSPPAIQPMTKKEWSAACEATRARVKAVCEARAVAVIDAAAASKFGG